MHISRASFLLSLAALPVSYALPQVTEPKYLDPKHYRVDEFIRAAVTLQSLDRETAIKRLHVMAQDIRSMGSVVILCRMLFTQRPGSSFRPPSVGQPIFFGRTTDLDWPLCPIELIDGIPFLIVAGYILGGLPESDESYLRYAESNCDWSSARYRLTTEQQRQGALKKLLASGKWKTATDIGDRQRVFAQQIQ